MRTLEHPLLTDFLLGRLPEEQHERLEARLLDDAEAFEELRIVEDELVDAFLRGELSPPERESFEGHYLRSSRQREKVEFARALAAVALAESKGRGEEAPEPDGRRFTTPSRGLRPGWLLPLAAGLALFVAVGVWLARSSPELELPAAPVAVDLYAGLLRDAGSVPVLGLPPQTSAVLRLELEPALAFEEYAAAVGTAAGQEVHRAEALQPTAVGAARMVELAVPAEVLEERLYVVTLWGKAPGGELELVDDYPLRVVIQRR